MLISDVHQPQTNQLVDWTEVLYFPVLEYYHAITLREVLGLVARDYYCLSTSMEMIDYDVLPQLFSDVRIDGRERVVEQHDICVRVDRTCERNSGLLAAGEVYALPSYFRLVPSGQ